MATIKKIYKNGVEYQMPQGPVGPQGDSVIVGEGDLPLSNVVDDADNKAVTPKAVKEVTNNLDVENKDNEAYLMEPTSLGEVVNYYINSSNAWTSGSTQNNCSFIPVTPGDVLRVTTGANSGNVEFMTSNDHTSSPPAYAAEKIGWLKQGTYYLTAPSGAAYLYVRRKLSNTSVNPTIRFLRETAKDKLHEVIDDELIWNLTQLTVSTPSSSANQRWIDRNTKVWKAQSSTGICGIYSCIPGQRYKIVGGTSIGGYAFLKTNTNTAGTTPDWATGCRLVNFVPGDTVYATAPSDAHYIYLELRYGDSSGTPSKPSYFGKVETVKDKVEIIDADVAAIKEETIYELTKITIPEGANYIDEGIWKGSTSNANGVVISTTPQRIYKIVVSADESTHYAWLKGNDRTKGQAPQYSDDCTLTSLAAGGTYELTAPADGNYLYLRKKKNSNYTVVSLHRITTVKEQLSGEGNDDTTTLIKHATYRKDGSGLPYFNILHYSDIHGSTTAAKNIVNAATKYGAYINEVVNTGDVIYSILGGSKGTLTWWNGCGLKPISLFTLGNHDDLINGDTREREGKAFLHTNYFPTDLIEDLGYVMPEGYDDPNSPNYQACFWHKDYADQKVRLIGLDCMDKYAGTVDPATGAITDSGNTGNEQEVWLCERLAETLPDSGDSAEGFTVVVLSHYPLDGYDVETYGENKEWDDISHKWICNHKSTGGRVINQKTLEVTNWHRYSKMDYEEAATMRWSNASGHNNIGEILEHYIAQDGSNFAAFVCGHTHNNLFFYPKKFPNVLNVCIDMAGDQRDMYYADQGTMGGFIANFLSFSTSAKRLRIVRLGVKSDVFLTPLNYICYDYALRKVIQEG